MATAMLLYRSHAVTRHPVRTVALVYRSPGVTKHLSRTVALLYRFCVVTPHPARTVERSHRVPRLAPVSPPPRQAIPATSVLQGRVLTPTFPPLGDGTTISFAGDVMWIGDNWSAFADGVEVPGDFRVANLETPTSPFASTEAGALGTYAFNAPPE
jgi:hypothetical protein